MGKMDRLSPALFKALEFLIEERHVTRAAGRMGVSQSAMSKMLSKLREVLKDELLVRVGNRLELTERAEEIAPRLSVISSEMGAILESRPFDPATCHRQFTLGVSDYVAQFVLPETLCDIQKKAPNMALSIVSQHASTLVEDLVENRIQIASALDVEGKMPPGLVCRWIATDTFACVTAQDHPFAKEKSLSAYLGAPHVVVTGGSDKAAPMEKALAALKEERFIGLKTDLFASAMEVVVQSSYILTVPAHIARHLGNRYRAKVTALPFEVPPFRYGLIWHERHRKDPAHAWLRQRLVAQLVRSQFSR